MREFISLFLIFVLFWLPLIAYYFDNGFLFGLSFGVSPLGIFIILNWD